MPCLRQLSALCLGGLMLVPSLGAAPARAANPTTSQLEALEAALNSGDDTALSALLSQGPGLNPQELKQRRQQLREQFPDVRWQVKTGPALRSGQPQGRRQT